MPPRKKVEKPVRPAHLSELCAECGTTEPHPTATHFACEHGSWPLAPFEAAEQGDDEFLDDLQGADE